MTTATLERRAARAGDESLMDAVNSRNLARSSYAAAGTLKRALTIEALRDLRISEANAWNAENA